MKKLIILSAIVGLAGIGIGIAGRQNAPAPSTNVAAATDITTTSSSVAAQAPATSPTTRPAAKATVKSTASTTRVAVPAVVTATSSTTRPSATTTSSAPVPTTTTTTTVAGPSPTCTATVANPSVHKGDIQTITIVSNMPTTKSRLTIQYPKFNTGAPNPRLEYTLTTDPAGSTSKSFSVGETSTVPVAVSVQFYDAAGHLVPGCQTTFAST